MAYVLLALTGLSAAVYAIATSKHKPQLILVLLAAATLIHVGDWIVYGWFHLFAYQPHLAATRLADEAWGQFLAEGLYLPGLLVFLLTLVPEWVGTVLFAGVSTAIEFLFDRWGLFAHLGWPLWLTVIGLAVIYVLMSRLWDHIRQRSLAEGRSIPILRLSLMFTFLGYLTLFLRALRFGIYHLHVLRSFGGNDALGRFLTYGLVAMPIGYWAASAQGTARWVRLGAGTALLVALNMVLAATGFRTFPRPWSPVFDGVLQGAAILAAAWVQDAIIALERDRLHV